MAGKLGKVECFVIRPLDLVEEELVKRETIFSSLSDVSEMAQKKDFQGVCFASYDHKDALGPLSCKKVFLLSEDQANEVFDNPQFEGDQEEFFLPMKFSSEDFQTLFNTLFFSNSDSLLTLTGEIDLEDLTLEEDDEADELDIDLDELDEQESSALNESSDQKLDVDFAMPDSPLEEEGTEDFPQATGDVLGLEDVSEEETLDEIEIEALNDETKGPKKTATLDAPSLELSQEGIPGPQEELGEEESPEEGPFPQAPGPSGTLDLVGPGGAVLDQVQEGVAGPPERRAQSLEESPPPGGQGAFHFMAQEGDSDLVELQKTMRKMRLERKNLMERFSVMEKELATSQQDHLTVRSELDERNIEINVMKKRAALEREEFRESLRASEEKRLILEEKLKKLDRKYAKVQHQVQLDLGKVKERERDLEGQLEIIQMDSQGQVKSRDEKILELRRKIDSMEFGMRAASAKQNRSMHERAKIEHCLGQVLAQLKISIKIIEEGLSVEEKQKLGNF